MADFQFGHVLSDETEQMLKELAERLDMTNDEVLEACDLTVTGDGMG